MNTRNHTGRAALVAGVAALVIAGLNPPMALATTGAQSIVSARNSSDPHVEGCNLREQDPVTGALVEKAYLCMYTSSDMTTEVPGMLFPMEQTFVYTMDTEKGLNPGDPASWVDRSVTTGPAFDEKQLPMSSGTKHLWAPTMHYGNNTHETLLYVPDIDPSVTIDGLSEDGHPSYIAVATTYWADANRANPWGPFTYKKDITYLGGNLKYVSRNFPDGKQPYMSDPAVATLGQTHPVTDEHPSGGPATWLLWANGDYNPNHHDKCGGISVGLLNDDDFTDLVTSPWRPGSEVQINGIAAALGECSPGLNHPYLEGPEIYDLSQVNLPVPTNPGTGATERFMLMFAAKPEGGTHGASNQVLAWATASSPMGPYTYRGILMDGSDSSWTNHGSIYATTINGSLQFLIFFHDETDSSPPHDRKSRAACLTYDLSDRTFLTAPRPSSIPDLRTCVGTQP